MKIKNSLKNSKILGIIPDKVYLSMLFKSAYGYKIDFNNPKTFNEKLQWLKLYNRDKKYTTMVDKKTAKEYVANLIGNEYIIPTIGIYKKFKDINFDLLPNQFVIKCTHDSGGLVIVKDKSKLDIEQARKKINSSLKRNYYYFGREWPYKKVKPMIIIEKYMEDESKYELKDYKIFCFNGIPKIIMVDSDRFSNHKRNVYDTDWNRLDISLNFPNCDIDFPKPSCLEKMLELSKELSKNIPFIRTDFYVINDKIYFGELTLFPGSGFQKIEPREWQYKLGDWIELPKNK